MEDFITPRFIANKTKLLYEIMEKISNEMNNLQWEIEHLQRACRLPENHYNWNLRRANIVKKINELMADGYSSDIAESLAAEELNENYEFVTTCFNVEKSHNVDLNRYAKKYMARRLLKMGYKNTEVAKITGWTPEYVSMLKNGKKPF